MKRADHLRRVGLARALSKLGYCSRARGFQLVRDARVRVNGALREDPESPVHIGKDQIEVDGKQVEAAERVYLMLNKPRGVVTTASDERGRETVYAYLEPSVPWVGPVGRLDKASEGLLLLTNDTEWANQVANPGTHLEKTYCVQIGAVADDALLERIQRGVKSADQFLRVKRASMVRRGEKNSWIEVVLDEGKNRQIRRILERLGIEVTRLIRVAIGPLSLGDLQKGRARRLSPEEKASMDRRLS